MVGLSNNKKSNEHIKSRSFTGAADGGLAVGNIVCEEGGGDGLGRHDGDAGAAGVLPRRQAGREIGDGGVPILWRAGLRYRGVASHTGDGAFQVGQLREEQ